ncbi:MAG: hypothetical protein ACKVSF_10515 [Alphaproteobacteria bacterium]
MIRRSALALLALAAALGFALYNLTYEVQRLETELQRTNKATLAESDTIRVLQAEWSYLNEPGRLSTLAKKHLHLAAVSGGRIKAVADLPARDGAPARIENVEVQTKGVEARLAKSGTP